MNVGRITKFILDLFIIAALVSFFESTIAGFDDLPILLKIFIPGCLIIVVFEWLIDEIPGFKK